MVPETINVRWRFVRFELSGGNRSNVVDVREGSHLEEVGDWYCEIKTLIFLLFSMIVEFVNNIKGKNKRRWMDMYNVEFKLGWGRVLA